MQNLYSAVIDFFKNAPRPVVVHEPHFSENEKKYVLDCIETGWVSSVGSYVDRFERDLSLYTDAYAIPVVNGTAALHLALILAGVKSGDEVLVSDLTFVATANAVHYCHAIPHFVEVDKETFAVDPEKLDQYLMTLKNHPKFLIVTHIFGNPAHIKTLSEVCDKYGIVLIEDAAESLGSYVDGKHTGTFGKVSALSFNGNKIITTGGGGAVLTTDKDMADRAKHLSTTAKVADPYSHRHDMVGYNYRMPNINAALGCAQLEKLPEFLEYKKQLAVCYKELFKPFDEVEFVKSSQRTISNYWLNNILTSSESARNNFIDRLAEEKIFCRGLWSPMSSLPMYKNCPKMDTQVAYDLCARTVSLPSSAMLRQYVKTE